MLITKEQLEDLTQRMLSHGENDKGEAVVQVTAIELQELIEAAECWVKLQSKCRLT